MLIAAGISMAALANSASATIFNDRAAFIAKSECHRQITFDGLVGSPSYPNNYPPGGGYYSNTGPIEVSGIKFNGGSKKFGWESYILTGTAGEGRYTLNGTSAAVIGRALAAIKTPGGSCFGMDFGSDRVRLSNFSFRISFGFADGDVETVTREGPSGITQFIGYVGKPIDFIVIENNTPAVGGFQPYFVFDNVLVGEFSTGMHAR